MTKDELADFYDKYHDNVYRTAYSYCQNKHDAEDIMHDVFIKCFSQNILFDDEKSEKAWVLKVTSNYCKDILRSLKYRIYKNSIPIDEANLTYETKEEIEVYYAVSSLSPKKRLIIHLYYYEEYSVKEISEITGKSETAVRNQLYQARNKLRGILGKEFEI